MSEAEAVSPCTSVFKSSTEEERRDWLTRKWIELVNRREDTWAHSIRDGAPQS